MSYGEPAGLHCSAPPPPPPPAPPPADSWMPNGGPCGINTVSQLGYVVISIDKQREPKTPRGRDWRKSTIWPKSEHNGIRGPTCSCRENYCRPTISWMAPGWESGGWSGGGQMTLNVYVQVSGLYIQTGIAVSFVF